VTDPKLKLMKVRSVEATVVLALALAASSLSVADQQPADFQSLYQGHHWFALRNAVEQGGPPQFYRGAVEAAFHQPPQATKDLEAIIRARPHEHDASEAHALLAGLYLRTGQYREAVVQTDALLAAKPDAEDAKNVRLLLRVLSETPDQAVVQKKPSTVRMHIEDGNLFLPVAINDALAEYALDTDAAVSLLSESEAKRLGLAMRDVQTKIEGMGGAGVGARVAVANTFTLGEIRLANVAFYVLPDKQPPFDRLTPGRQGILGIPVILALETLRWNPRNHTFECGFPSRGQDLRHSNISFDGASPLTEVRFRSKLLEFSLDTGAQNTDLYPSFAKDFAGLLSAEGKKQSRQLTGVDGSASFDSVLLPSVTLGVGAHDVVLKPAHVLLVQHNGNSAWYFGNLGIDLLNQANTVTLDLQAMTLTLE
jgi:tetratricopeptide (TPR) repeat protein